MKILEELWYGQVCPAEMKECRDEDYQDLMELFDRNEKKLLPTLNQGQRENWQKMKDLWKEMEEIQTRSAFVAGFRLAVQLMAASV